MSARPGKPAPGPIGETDRASRAGLGAHVIRTRERKPSDGSDLCRLRTAMTRRGVAVVVMPGEVFLAEAPRNLKARPVRTSSPIVRPPDEALAAAASVLNRAKAVTILAGAGVAGAHDELIELAPSLKAPIVHALRG